MKDPRHIGNDWDAVLHQELKSLPPLQAPPQLMASVLREARRRTSLPWWQKSFWFWPPVVRAMVLIWLVLLGAALMLPAWIGIGTLGEWVGRTWGVVDGLESRLGWLGGWNLLLDRRSALGSLLTQSPWFIAALLLAGLLYLTCVAAGSALFRLVLHPTQGR